ncbi:serine hydrolase [Candidatus Francisella endociliophora]|uniref:serine hydrolase n=1 Tax=Candidatus Francisella endociliophora TaxID=653937 RepID=UPI000693C4AD|nr:serine hydrolase [Francisella sp. FSC1006]
MIKKIVLITSLSLGIVFGASQTEDSIFKNVDTIIQNDVDNGFGGAVLAVIKDGEVIKESAYGYRDRFKSDCITRPDYTIPNSCYLEMAQRAPMTVNTKFDLASLTKIYSTVFSMMHLVYQGKLDLNKPVADYIQDYPYKDITVKQVAEHTAGFGPEVNFYNRNDVMYNGKTVEENGFYSQDRATTLDFITGRNDSDNNPNYLVVPREYEPGTKNIYSDTDFMLLGTIIEHITGKSQDKYVKEEIYKPLGIQLTYKPLENGVDINQIAQTAIGNWDASYSEVYEKYLRIEFYDNMRLNPIRGHSQDEKLFYSMGEVSGHAGLFGSVEDLEPLVKLLLNGGSYNGVTLFDQKTLDLFTTPVATNDTYGIGWRLAGDDGKMAWMMGDYASDKAFGHTGFTGMVTVIDPKKNFAVILLTDKLQSQQLSKGSFKSSQDYKTPNYGSIMTPIEEDIEKYLN